MCVGALCALAIACAASDAGCQMMLDEMQNQLITSSDPVFLIFFDP
jgi:hypothetical protein